MAYTVRTGRVWLTEMGSPGTGPDPTAMSRVDVVAAGKGGTGRVRRGVGVCRLPAQARPSAMRMLLEGHQGWGPVSRAEP